MKKENLNYTPSVYDDLYYELTGKYLAKEGTAYEKITAAVIGILTSKGVVHDTKIRGLSGTLYQIDGLVDQIIMIEAKDYQKRNSNTLKALLLILCKSLSFPLIFENQLTKIKKTE